MDIKELTERNRDRFDAHYLQDDNGTGRKGRKRKKEVETPNFLKDVIRPILDTLPDLLPWEVFPSMRILTCTSRHCSMAKPAVRVKKSTASDNSLKSSANNLKEGR